MSPQALVARCVRMGLDCIAVTDHHTTRGAYAVRELAPFPVIVGEEIRSSQGEIIGLFLKETVPSGLSALETVRRIKEQGGLVSVPHPFDRFRRGVITPEALEEIAPYVDMVEAFNARNSAQADNLKAQEFARRHGLRVCAVTDSHTPLEVGRTYVELPEFDGTPQGLLAALDHARLVTRRMSPLIHVLTAYTKAKKRLARRWGGR